MCYNRFKTIELFHCSKRTPPESFLIASVTTSFSRSRRKCFYCFAASTFIVPTAKDFFCYRENVYLRNKLFIHFFCHISFLRKEMFFFRVAPTVLQRYLFWNTEMNILEKFLLCRHNWSLTYLLHLLLKNSFCFYKNIKIQGICQNS